MKYNLLFETENEFQNVKSKLDTPSLSLINETQKIYLKTQKSEIITMTFDLDLGNSFFTTQMFKSLMCDGNELLDGKSFELINTKDSVQNSINYITEKFSSLTLKVSRPLTENNYLALVMNNPEYNEVTIDYIRCTEENMAMSFGKIDDTTYTFALIPSMNEIIKNGGQVSIISFDTIDGLQGDVGQFADFELFNSNINNIISTTLEYQTPISFPSSEGIYILEGKLKKGVTSIEYEAFASCKSLTNIEIPSSVTSIGGRAFSGCSSLTSIIFADDSQLTSIGESAFVGCPITSIEIPNSVTSIENGAFTSCKSLTSIIFANDSQLVSIGGMAFYGCPITSIEIPNSVTSIGGGAFQYCGSLTSIEIPSGVTSIGNGAFKHCGSLTSITCHAITAPSVQSDTFRNVAENGTLYYPEGSDYSSWLSSKDYYLGKYEWQGAIINGESL